MVCSGTGALRTSDIGGARLRAGFQPMRGDRRERKDMLCQWQKRRCGKRGGSQRLRTATFAASFFSDRGRSGTMGGHNVRAVRTRGVQGKSVSVRVDPGGRRLIQNKKG